VRQGEAILTLLGASTPRVRFGVPVGTSSDLALHTSVQVQVEGSAAPLRARVDRIAPAIDAATRLLFVEAALSDCPPGQLGRRARVSLLR
jgi:hypothetical protein